MQRFLCSTKRLDLDVIKYMYGLKLHELRSVHQLWISDPQNTKEVSEPESLSLLGDHLHVTVFGGTAEN